MEKNTKKSLVKNKSVICFKNSVNKKQIDEIFVTISILFKFYFPDLFRWLPKKIDSKLKERIFQPIKDWKKNISNDFEDNIFRKYNELQFTKQVLYKKGAIYASMSGTGSTVYGIFNK